MCLLVVVRGRFASHPILVAANRDERLDRRSAPPGLWVGRRLRVVSPRDREAGGTWLGVNERGAFAGLTNVAGVPAPAGAASRGELVHLALDAPDLQAGMAAVIDAFAGAAPRPFGGFQLVLCDGARTVVVRNRGRGPELVDWRDDVLVITNLHGPGELQLRGLAQALAPAADAAQQLELLRPLLLDRGEHGGHPVLKHGDAYGTVSSSLIAVPAGDPRALVWRYAAGPPDVAEYRNYGNLGRRLLPETEPLPPDRRDT